jgi:hypothetical protein
MKTTVRSDDVLAGFSLCRTALPAIGCRLKVDRQELGRQHREVEERLIRFIEDHASVRQRHGF